MSDNKILEDIYKKRDNNFLYKMKLIKENKDIRKYYKEISKNALDLAKMSLQKNNLKSIEIEKLKNNIEKYTDKYNNLMNIKYDCNECKDTGFVDGKVCNCFRSMVKSQEFESQSGNLPLSFYVFENFDFHFYPSDPLEGFGCSVRSSMKKVFKFCYDYSHNFSSESESLVFFGGNGLGKTHLSLSIANVLIKNDFDVSYVSFSKEVIESDIRNFNKKRFFGCDLLIIDDLGSEVLTSFVISFLYDIVNTRVMSRLATILVTNLSIKELEKVYKPRMVSRIVGNFRRIQFFGRDIRQQKLELKNKR